jgi:hypothetical protein
MKKRKKGRKRRGASARTSNFTYQNIYALERERERAERASERERARALSERERARARARARARKGGRESAREGEKRE